MAKNKNKSKIIKPKQSRAPKSTKNKRKPTKNTKNKPKATRATKKATKKGNKRKQSAWQIFIREYAAAHPNLSQRHLWRDASLAYRKKKSDAYTSDTDHSDSGSGSDSGSASDSEADSASEHYTEGEGDTEGESDTY